MSFSSVHWQSLGNDAGALVAPSAGKRELLAEPGSEPRLVDLACRDREHRVDRLVDIRPRATQVPSCQDRWHPVDARSGRHGWKFDNDLGYEDTNWQWRAWAGLQAVLSPVPSRSRTSANCWDDSDGRLLSGEYRYTITFDLNDMPPSVRSSMSTISSQSTSSPGLSTFVVW